jgi:hypothetical protein
MKSGFFSGGAGSLIFQNGAQVASGNAGASTPGGIYIGVYGDGISAPLTGSVTEVVDVIGTLSAANRTNLETYFHGRYVT